MFFPYIKSAFDKVEHEHIIEKLRQLKYTEKDLYFISLMLKGHTKIKVNKENTNIIREYYN